MHVLEDTHTAWLVLPLLVAQLEYLCIDIWVSAIGGQHPVPSDPAVKRKSLLPLRTMTNSIVPQLVVGNAPTILVMTRFINDQLGQLLIRRVGESTRPDGALCLLVPRKKKLKLQDAIWFNLDQFGPICRRLEQSNPRDAKSG